MLTTGFNRCQGSDARSREIPKLSAGAQHVAATTFPDEDIDAGLAHDRLECQDVEVGRPTEGTAGKWVEGNQINFACDPADQFDQTQGIGLANASWAVAAGLGITTVLVKAPIVFTAIRFGGAAYLAYLGLRALIRAWHTAADGLPTGSDSAPTSPELSSAFRDGVAVNLLNPPIAMFYLVVVPSFMPAPSAGRFALLASIHVTMAFVCHAVWAIGFDALRGIWTRPAARGSVEAAVGIALLALAIRMLR